MHTRWAAILRAPWWPAAPVLLVQLASGIWYMPPLSFFPIYLEERLGLAPVAIAAIVSAGQIAGMVSGVIGGVLSDAIGSTWVLILGLICSSAAFFAFLTPTPWLVAALWVVNGIAVGLHTLGGSSYLTRVASPRSLGVLSALYELSITLGGALGNPIAGVLLDTRGFGAFGLVMLALSGATLLGTVLFLPRLPGERGGRQVSERRPEGNAWVGAIQVFRRPIVILLVFLRYLPTVYYGAASVLVPLAINHISGRKTTVAIYITTSLVVASLTQLAAGRIADRYGRRWPVLVGFGIIVFSALGLSAFGGELWGIFVFGLIGYSAAWALAALMFCLVSDAVAPVEHGRVLGLLHGAWSIGMASGAMLGGSLVKIAPGLPFLATALLNVGAIGLALAYFSRLARSQQAHSDPKGL